MSGRSDILFRIAAELVRFGREGKALGEKELVLRNVGTAANEIASAAAQLRVDEEVRETAQASGVPLNGDGAPTN